MWAMSAGRVTSACTATPPSSTAIFSTPASMSASTRRAPAAASRRALAAPMPRAAPDTITLSALRASPPKVLAEIEAPTSVVGPPLSVAITPDESLALVTAAMRIDPADPSKQIPDARMSVIDLKASPPKIVATLEAGPGAAGVSINRQGTLALVANRSDGTVSVFTLQGQTVTPAGKVTI